MSAPFEVFAPGMNAQLSSVTLLANRVLQNQEVNQEPETTVKHESPLTTDDMLHLSQNFPFTSSVHETPEILRTSIISLLPPPATARRLVDIYYQYASWR